MPKRVDRNQPEIVAALRGAGCSVQHLHGVGRGCPDLLVGVPWQEANVLLEIKHSDGTLTPVEREWHLRWRGTVHTVRTVAEALAVCGVPR